MAVRCALALAIALSLGVIPAAAEPTARFGDVPARPTPKAAPAPQPPADGVREPRRAAREPWGRSSARELVRRAEAHAVRGDPAVALTEYNEALRFDPSYGPAYLGLAGLREALRDLAEAERVYDAAARLPDSRADALAGRARVRRALGRDDDAFRDLEISVELVPQRERLRTLADWYVERRAWPAALGAWRRLLSLLEAEESVDRQEARLRVQALTVLASESDPVQAPPSRSWVRRSMASMAKRPR
jgi:tetratricopeptide (TPR) repeat protein